MLVAVHHLVRHHTQSLLAEGGGFFETLGEVLEGEVDLFVVRIEVETGGVGDAAHGAQDEGDGADVGDVVGAVGCVEVPEDVGDGVGDEVGGVDGGEEEGRGGVGEGVEVEAEGGLVGKDGWEDWCGVGGANGVVRGLSGIVLGSEGRHGG